MVEKAIVSLKVAKSGLTANYDKKVNDPKLTGLTKKCV